MTLSHSDVLNILARSGAEPIKAFAETLLPALEEVNVLKSQTGLVMLPMRDTAQGTAFHLGEVLVSEAHIKLGETEGFGMRRGRDLEAAMGMALIDAALQTGVETVACKDFLQIMKDIQSAEDRETLCKVEATRVNMETF